MNKSEKLILMYKDFEVLSFTVDLANEDFEVIEKLERFDLAPFGMDNPDKDLNKVLSVFFTRRLISSCRWDNDLILKHTGCKNSLELAFKGHGLSLSNHYWFKKENEYLRYEDINFFTNKWDDSFARAILNGDYESLSKCDLNVPDVFTPGWSIKGWIYDNGPKLIKLGINKDEHEDSLTEVLASRLAQRILNKDEVLSYELVEFNGKYGSESASMLKIDEELIPFSRVVPAELYMLFQEISKDKDKAKLFYKRLKEEYPQYYLLFIKIAVIKSLCFVSDLHFDNISVIRNIETGEFKLAPLYDLAGAFGSSQHGKKMISKIDKSTYFLVYFFFSNLDPDWDYSWYDPTKLEGFENEIREYLSKSSFYTPELIEKIVGVFMFQKETLDNLAKK